MEVIIAGAAGILIGITISIFLIMWISEKSPRPTDFVGYEGDRHE